MIRYTCPLCANNMERVLERPDPHTLPEWVIRCTNIACAHKEPVPADVEAVSEERPRMPGL